MKQSMAKNGLILGLFAVITTGLIAFTYYSTKDQIHAQQQQKLLAILNAVVDKNSYTNDIQLDCTVVTSAEFLGSAQQKQHIYRARKDGQPVAVAIETTAPDGYNGKIQLVVGLIGEGTVSGVRVLEHKETPGLGDKIDIRISDWILSFNTLTFNNENIVNWAVKKDGGQFDQFTGATITPRAVVEAVKRSIEYYQANKTAIFEAPNKCKLASQKKPIGQ